MPRITVGIIGSWGHTADVLTQLEATPHVECVGLANACEDDNFDLWLVKFPKLAAANRYAHPEEMLATHRPAVVIIGTRLDGIAPLASLAAGYGCHLICEKPIASTIFDLKRLWKSLSQQPVACISMLSNIDRPAITAAQAAVKNGQIGSVIQAHVRKTYKWGKRPEWFGDPKIYPGSIAWVGIHALDVLSLVTGLGPLAVSALSANSAHHSYPACDDHADLLLSLPQQATATISIDYLRPETASTHGDDYIRLVGTHGQLEAFPDRERHGICRLLNDQGERDLPLPPAGHVYRSFIHCIEANEREKLLRDTHRAFRMTYLALLARDAAASRATLQVDNLFL